MSEQTYSIQVSVELRLSIQTESLDDAKRLGLAAGEFLLQCARWEELREFQEIHLVGSIVDPNHVHELPANGAESH